MNKISAASTTYVPASMENDSTMIHERPETARRISSHIDVLSPPETLSQAAPTIKKHAVITLLSISVRTKHRRNMELAEN